MVGDGLYETVITFKLGHKLLSPEHTHAHTHGHGANSALCAASEVLRERIHVLVRLRPDPESCQLHCNQPAAKVQAERRYSTPSSSGSSSRIRGVGLDRRCCRSNCSLRPSICEYSGFLILIQVVAELLGR